MSDDDCTETEESQDEDYEQAEPEQEDELLNRLENTQVEFGISMAPNCLCIFQAMTSETSL